MHPSAIGSSGGDQPHENMSPYQVVNFCVAAQTPSTDINNAYIGEIRIFGGNTAPEGWLSCNGQLLAIQTNPVLYSLLGTTYGGNGITNFAVPNLQARTPLSFGQGPGLTQRVLGDSGGEATVALGRTE